MTGEELKKWRKANRYSQNRLAKVLNVDVMTVSRWERNVRSIPPFLHLALKYIELEENAINNNEKEGGYTSER